MQHDDPDPAQTPSPRPADRHPGGSPERAAARVRREPRLLPFLLIGTVLGIALAGLATVLGPSDAMYSSGRSFGFLAVMFGATGLVLGGLLFVMADAVAQRRR
ncbi:MULTISPECIES: hypothetical protein [Kytococcus]|uniref:Potassium transporter Trk n=1 Tax=Kytococcus schroeteri TaxID=138300 RepID=A0A2I1P8E8_9MICO|nr:MULTISPECIES: hypothetical protein [Kytococcus]OFS15299.1 hypothetical protein HMPREF3099_02400 [Kytococcus sp. HMSC28H12]PKZ40915.1 hypothetical protein CYJ76_10345 [Kytococcus schroeteri]